MTSVEILDTPPSEKEWWKYTPVKEITRILENASYTSREDSINSTTIPVSELDGLNDTIRIVTINGYFAQALSNIEENIPGIIFSHLAKPAETTNPLISKVLNNRTISTVTLDENREDIIAIDIEPNAKIEKPIHIIHISSHADTNSQGNISRAKTVINLSEHSNAQIIESFIGQDANSINDCVTAIKIGDQANLDFYRTQKESQTTTHIGSTQIELMENSNLLMVTTTNGASIARNAIEIQFLGSHSQALVSGINTTHDTARHDTLVRVDHSSSYCTSNQNFVGVVDGSGRSSFSGEIIVHPDVIRTDAHQTNRNLLLNDRAKADSRPWLRIYADDVQCTHGATVGRLDDSMLFYLRSRGINIDKARSMLVEAFINNITDDIENKTIRDYIINTLAISPEHK